MTTEEYPALFRSADAASNHKQRTYLWLILLEYALLLMAAVCSLSVFSGTGFYLFYAFIFGISIVVLLTRALMKPEQDWYKCRALAESVKTLTWRYMLRATPFGGPAQAARAEFRAQLQKLFEANKAIAEKIDPSWSAADQITAEMDRVRAMNLAVRRAHYSDRRVRDQAEWYERKARFNRRASRRWVLIGILSYVVAAVLVLTRISAPEWTLWPIEPVIVFASSVVGWMQIKKFNELSAAYTVTAHEIGLIRPLLHAANNEVDLSEAVNDAEMAFSREHTLWIARQSN